MSNSVCSMPSIGGICTCPECRDLRKWDFTSENLTAFEGAEKPSTQPGLSGFQSAREYLLGFRYGVLCGLIGGALGTAICLFIARVSA